MLRYYCFFLDFLGTVSNFSMYRNVDIFLHRSIDVLIYESIEESIFCCVELSKFQCIEISKYRIEWSYRSVWWRWCVWPFGGAGRRMPLICALTLACFSERASGTILL